MTRRFQAQRATLVTQRQAIYARLQRPQDPGFTSDECIAEFLKARPAEIKGLVGVSGGLDAGLTSEKSTSEFPKARAAQV